MSREQKRLGDFSRGRHRKLDFHRSSKPPFLKLLPRTDGLTLKHRRHEATALKKKAKKAMFSGLFAFKIPEKVFDPFVLGRVRNHTQKTGIVVESLRKETEQTVVIDLVVIRGSQVCLPFHVEESFAFLPG